MTILFNLRFCYIKCNHQQARDRVHTFQTMEKKDKHRSSDSEPRPFP